MKPILVLGPCSIEGSGQLDELVESFRAYSIRPTYLRGGAWKPRTYPGGFEGLGEPGLRLLVKAGLRLGVPTCTEVASAAHVLAARAAGIDAYWIGARTTGSPFLVEEIAREIEPERVVFVKNPMDGSPDAWGGTIERLRAAGVKTLIGVHRGAKLSKASKYRNAPIWETAKEVAAKYGIPMITDPSHIAGAAGLVPKVVAISRELGFDGLMIEVHPRPSMAYTDAAQQIRPRELRAMLDAEPDAIAPLRDAIDEIDAELFRLVVERLEVSRQIGLVKSARRIPIFDAKREDEIRARISERYGDDPVISDVLSAILKRSKEVQL